MTIKVCHQKFNSRIASLGNCIKIFLMGFVPLFLIGGGIYGVFTFGRFLEIFGWMGIFGGCFALLIIFVINPWMWGDETIFTKLNRKIKLFAWNEDC